MQSTQHTRCPVLLHPACTTNPAAVRAVQQATGQLVVVNGGKARLIQSQPLFLFVTGEKDFLPADKATRRFFVIDEIDNGPFGGDAA